MRILFVCIENAGRSQMAEAFARRFVPPDWEVFSAGSQPAKAPHPLAISAMQELGIDLSQNRPKGFDALPEGPFDVVVGMGCGEACPAHRTKRVVNWEIQNPKGQPTEAVRTIRDQIKTHVQALLKELLQENTPS
jgi:arsenate reductase (thioredoxin)